MSDLDGKKAIVLDIYSLKNHTVYEWKYCMFYKQVLYKRLCLKYFLLNAWQK